MVVYRGYEISNRREHVIITLNDNFVSTADDIEEAKHDIDDLIKGQENDTAKVS